MHPRTAGTADFIFEAFKLLKVPRILHKDSSEKAKKRRLAYRVRQRALKRAAEWPKPAAKWRKMKWRGNWQACRLFREAVTQVCNRVKEKNAVR